MHKKNLSNKSRQAKKMSIHRINVVDEVVKHLETNLLSGIWQPGQKIDTEYSLSNQLNVSRASIHTAIQQLVAMGVLESHQGKGTFVRSISMIEIRNKLSSRASDVSLRKMTEFRIIMEGQICKSIAPHISHGMIKQLYKYVDSMEEHKFDPQITKNCDIQFHRLLYFATQNELIIQSMDIIRDEMDRWHVANHTPERIVETIKEHREIVDCLRARDGEGAKRAMQLHLASAPPNDPPFDLDNIEESLFVIES